MTEEGKNQENTPKAKRGFAAMNPEKQRQIASKGGRTAHEQGVAHEWNKEEAKQAGKKGGQVSGNKRRQPDRNSGEEII